MPTISIQRSLLIALLGLSTVVSSAQSRFDKWKFPTCTTKKGPNGLQGIVDSSGQWVVQPYFDFLFFPYRCYLGEARYKGSNDYYIIDRDFNPNRSLEKVSCHFLMTAIRKIALYMLDS